MQLSAHVDVALQATLIVFAHSVNNLAEFLGAYIDRQTQIATFFFF